MADEVVYHRRIESDVWALTVTATVVYDDGGEVFESIDIGIDDPYVMANPEQVASMALGFPLVDALILALQEAKAAIPAHIARDARRDLVPALVPGEV